MHVARTINHGKALSPNREEENHSSWFPLQPFLPLASSSPGRTIWSSRSTSRSATWALRGGRKRA
jgi:hypothetical protein